MRNHRRAIRHLPVLTVSAAAVAAWLAAPAPPSTTAPAPAPRSAVPAPLVAPPSTVAPTTASRPAAPTTTVAADSVVVVAPAPVDRPRGALDHAARALAARPATPRGFPVPASVAILLWVGLAVVTLAVGWRARPRPAGGALR